jgi:hypothetical protein
MAVAQPSRATCKTKICQCLRHGSTMAVPQKSLKQLHNEWGYSRILDQPAVKSNAILQSQDYPLLRSNNNNRNNWQKQQQYHQIPQDRAWACCKASSANFYLHSLTGHCSHALPNHAWRAVYLFLYGIKSKNKILMHIQNYAQEIQKILS